MDNDDPYLLEINYRNPISEDAQKIWKLIKKSPPLDLNSIYNYLLLCTHFKKTCVVVQKKDEIIAFVSGYLLPENKNTLFIWQVVVSFEYRGKGIAKKMLKHILNAEICKNVQYLETSVNPENQNSKNVFYSFAKERGAAVHEEVLFAEDLFGNSNHDKEILIKIGSFKKRKD